VPDANTYLVRLSYADKTQSLWRGGPQACRERSKYKIKWYKVGRYFMLEN
jgi:hypothetical protein